MKFEVEWRKFYVMAGLEGQEPWSIQKFTSISQKTNFKMSSAFANKDENPELLGSDWNFNFSQQRVARLEKIIEMGFKEGLLCK
jgi:hypothetical protein